MDKILITYRGGYGDIHSVLASYPPKKKQEITFLVEDDHAFLKNIYPWIRFIRNPIYQIYDQQINREKIIEHIAIKENKNFNQRLYDESIVETSFYIWSQYQPYLDFYKKLIIESDLVVTNYLDLTCIKVCQEVNKEWWLIKSWHDWPTDSFYLNLFNQSSPYRNLYYYEREWIKDFKTEERGEYRYLDTNLYDHNYDESKERFNLLFKTKGKEKIFFATLGSMSRDNLNIGRMVHKLFIKKINELFMDGWYGMTTEREYQSFIKEEASERWLFLAPPWYSHDRLLDYSSLFLTHGGAGSFSRAMHKKKKMIVFPFQLDQFYFGEIVKKHYNGEMIV